MKEQEQQEMFNRWISQFTPLLVKIVRGFAFARVDQDDLFQEISLQAWRSVPTFRNQCSESTWLYRIALNTAIKWSQKEKKHRGNESIEELQVLAVDNGSPTDERLAWIYEEIARMNLVDRSLTLLLLDGLSYRDMAGIMGITESNIGVKLNRIRKKLIDKSKTLGYGNE